ncbi:MAG: Gp49 family protein [Lysobacterales bacterium]
MSDREIEKKIQAKGLTAPRITPADIKANITSEFYFTGAQGADGAAGYQQDAVQGCIGYDQLRLLTFCVLVLRNGFTVTGESACASPENFDAELGREIARQNAVNKVWPLMGYSLKEQLYRGEGVGTCSDMDGLVLTEADAIADLNGEPRPDAGQEAIRRGMTFGGAIAMLKNGCRVARAGWNGKGMWISLSCDGSREVAAENFWSPHNAEFARENGGSAIVQPCITMKNAQGEIQMGWAATQSDMLSEDWLIV